MLSAVSLWQATNRNFKGRMGSRKAEAYLGSPAVVAASALAGVICGPSYLHTADDDDAERQAAAAAQQQEEDQQRQQEEGEEEDRQARAADVDAAEASVKALGDQIRARKAAGAGKDDVAEAVGALLAAKEALRAAALAHVAALESADDVDAAALEAARARVPPLSKAERKAQEQQQQQQQQQPVEEGASLAELLFAPVELQEPEFAPYPPPSAPVPPSGAAAVVTSFAPGFQTKREGEMLFCHEDNLNTDGIFAGTHTYKENLTDEDMARLAMENYDPKFAAMARAGDLLVGGFNFGCGSSREQAATALRCAGIDVVLAGWFSAQASPRAPNGGNAVSIMHTLTHTRKLMYACVYRCMCW